MKPADLKPGDWLVIRDPLADREYRARFEERLPSLGYGDPALSRLFCPDLIGQPGVDDAGCCTFTDSELARHGRVLLEVNETEAFARAAALPTQELNAQRALLDQALAERLNVTQWLDRVTARAVVAAPGGGSEIFDDAVCEAWQAAGLSFDAASLLAGLITAYGAAVKGGGDHA